MRRLVLLVLVISGVASAQRGGRPRTCILEWNDLPPTSHSSISSAPNNKRIFFFGGGFKANCRGTDMLIFGDSAEYFEDLGVMTLIGNARYTEQGTTITANLMRYNENSAQVFAEGTVRVRMKDGSTLEADLLQYLRPQLPARNFSQADASGRTRLVMRDSVAIPDSAATVITADRLHMLRDTLFYAGGSVVITAPDLIGTGDSASTNSKNRRATLLGAAPQLKGRGTRTFTIDGNLIDIYGRERQVERLIARGKAVAVSDSLTLNADTLDIRTTGTAIDRVEAWGSGRARAVSPGRDISARRLVITMPGQKLRDLRAYGQARAETTPDSTVITKDRDWIEGDTLTALFEQSVNQAQSSQPPMRSLVAQGSARSFYQSKSEDKACTDPALSYVTGKHINVIFKTGQVNEVQVTGSVRGLNASPCKTATDSVPPRRGTDR